MRASEICVTLIVTLGLIVTGAFTSSRAYAADSGEIAWAENLDAAIERAQADNTLIFLDVYADWCPPCQKMIRETFTNPAVIDALQDFVPLKVDSDNDPATAQQYGVQALPTLFVLTSDGAPLVRHEGFLAAEGFLQFLQKGNERIEQIAALESELRNDPGDAGRTLALANLYNELGRARDAVTLLEQAEPALSDDTPRESRAEIAFSLGLAYLMDGAYAKGVAKLEAFAAENPEHGRFDHAQDLIIQGKVFDALARIHEGEYDGARSILEGLVETADSPQVVTFAESLLGQLEVLGQPAPAWAVSWAGRAAPSLQGLQGKVTALVLVSLDDSASSEVALRIEALRNEFHDKGFEALAVVSQANSGQEADAGEVRAWAEARGLTYPVGIDRDGRATHDAYRTERMPWLALIGRDGVVHYLGGYDDAEVNDKLQRLLSPEG